MRHFSFILMISFFGIIPVAGQVNTTVLSYIEKYKDIAIQEMLRTGVPASITLAQGILESQAGNSELALESNNHFGIKCKSDWTGEVHYYDDDAKQECFRSYSSAEESFYDHSNFLKTRPNYSFLFSIPVNNYEAWAKGLKKAGYATNPLYAQKIIKYIHDYNLQQFTLLAMQKKQNKKEIVIADKKSSHKETLTTTNSSRVVTVASEPVSTSYPEGIFSINQTKVMYAKKGSSLFALAANYGIPYKKLLEFNELQATDILDDPSLIFLEKKPKKGKNPYHIVAANETIEGIAQTEGVQLESLLVYNHIVKGNQPVSGEKIFLQQMNNDLVKINKENTR